MLEFIIGMVFIDALLVMLFIYNSTIKGRQEVEKRFTEVVGKPVPTSREQELKVPLIKRAIKPFLVKLAARITKVLPAGKEAELYQKINKAGITDKIAPRELLVLKYLAGAGAALTLWALSWLLSGGVLKPLLLGGTGLGLGWYLPDIYLSRKSNQRKQDVDKSLPDVLDLLTVSVEAGLGFDGALMKVAEKTKGVLSSEFTTMLNEIKMGKHRQEALRDMAKRVEVDDLSTFTGSVILADQLGISIGNVLRLQSEQIRQNHRQRAEEMAMKTPIKIIFPLVFFIFPAIFIVLLGPAAIQMANTFMK